MFAIIAPVGRLDDVLLMAQGRLDQVGASWRGPPFMLNGRRVLTLGVNARV